MLTRLYRIFLRYCDENLRRELRGTPLVAPRDAAVQVDRIALLRNRLIVEGWCRAERIGLRLNKSLLWVTPDLAQPGQDLRGFTLDMPFEAGQPVLVLPGREESPIALPAFSASTLFWARTRLLGAYLWAIFSLRQQIWQWKIKGDLGAREVIKERLGLVPRSDAVEISGDVLGASPEAVPAAFATASVVMPVYNAFEVLCEALSRAERHADLPLRMILIEDCSSDPRVRPYLSAWACAPERTAEVRLILNESNLGFIGAVNRGFAEARLFPEDPVVLLNSDALLPAGWTSRLLAPLADPNVASVTPMSNDAEIFDVPAICQRGSLAPGQADLLDAAAKALHPTAGLVEAPTGVGFCMAMAPRYLALVPEFDTAFGRGYGEETDWCQKTRRLGGRHLGTPHLFVEHRGGLSFGSAAKVKLLERNGAEISRRYPDYDREVQGFIRSDPLVSARLALGLSWAALRQEGEVPVYLAHAMGGGAENDLQRRILTDLAAGGSAVVLRVGQGHRWKLELHSPLGLCQGLSNDEALIRRLVERLPRRRIVYSCGVGERDPLGLPDLLLGLAGRGALPLAGGPQPIEVLLHDFFVISPSYTLLGQDGGFHGLPVPATPPGEDPAHRSERPGGVAVTLADWQAAWRPLLQAAERITVFSQSSRDLLRAAYPVAGGAITVAPHQLLTAIPTIAPATAANGRRVIGVLGNIGQQKGAAVVQAMSKALARRTDLGLVVVGHLDPAYRLTAPARVHGSYEWRDLPGLVTRYGISAWLIPSVWPETFSFTTHEAIATGMPVFCFDLGAQADALRVALAQGASGGLLDLTADVESLLAQIERQLAQ